jgi:hypothetical protein
MTLLTRRAWLYSTNNRIAYTSLNTTMRTLLFQLKTFLNTNGYTVIGSSNGTAATPAGLLTLSNDGVDRWLTAADAGIRGASAAVAQSWIVLRDGNGVDILLAYQGTSDDVCYISFSPGNLYTVQTTTTFQPTAADEQIVTSNSSVITTNLDDRIWHGWVAADAKAFRFVVARAGVIVGARGVEDILSCVQPPAVFNPPVVGFNYDRSGLLAIFDTFSNTRGGRALVRVANLAANVTLGGGLETALGASTLATFWPILPELQGGSLRNVNVLSWWATTVNARGKLGQRVDWWQSFATTANDGAVYNLRQYINIAGSIWPWNGSVPVLL